MEIAPLGDAGLIVRFKGEADETIGLLLAAQKKLGTAELPGVLDIVPASAALAVFYDPTKIASLGTKEDEIFEFLAARVRRELSSLDQSSPTQKARTVDIPVCFDREFAPDLDDLVHRTGLAANTLIDRYCQAAYRVSCIGFTPGFPYLSGLPPELVMPRRAIPRKEVAAGSVAIGGNHTGIYPTKSPGGWNIIGRTPLRLFNPTADPPSLLRAGDRVRFHPVQRDEFERAAR